MRRLAPVFLLMITLALGGVIGSRSVHAADEKAVDAEQAEAPKAGGAKAPIRPGEVRVIEIPADSPKAPIPGGPSDQNALWWNDLKIVKSLSLTDEQRSQMTGLLKAYRAQVPKDRKPEAFHEALVQGNWKAARGESDKLAKSAAKSIGMRGGLKIDTLALLSDEQRKLLVDRYPRLVYKPWRRAMRGDSSR